MHDGMVEAEPVSQLLQVDLPAVVLVAPHGQFLIVVNQRLDRVYYDGHRGLHFQKEIGTYSFAGQDRLDIFVLISFTVEN